MAAYKDEKRGTWFVSFHYNDWTGKNCREVKRGFKTRREAVEWEQHFLMKEGSDLDMTFSEFVAAYTRDMQPKLKHNTWLTKEHIIRTKLLPYFKDKKMRDYNKGAKEGEAFTTTNQFISDTQSKFKPTIISIEKLTEAEKKVYEKTEEILSIISGKPTQVREIQITEKIYDSEFYYETVGLWQPEEYRILIKRKQLRSISEYAGTLLHEYAHAKSGAGDVNRDFESELTSIIGSLVSKLI